MLFAYSNLLSIAPKFNSSNLFIATAIPPATCGVAIEVPLIYPYLLSFNVDLISPPGAVISGFISRLGAGPQLEKLDIWPLTSDSKLDGILVILILFGFASLILSNAVWLIK